MLLNSPICCYWQGLFKVQMNLLKFQHGGGQRFQGTFKNGQQGGGPRFERTLMMMAAAGDKGSKEPLKMGSRVADKGSKEPLKILLAMTENFGPKELYVTLV
jgi:hypothetical protein